MGSGSSVYALAEQITGGKNLTVVTSSIHISYLLNTIDDISVIQLGGVLRKSSYSAVGETAIKAFDEIACSKFFMGVDGIDLDYGLTTSNIDEARLNRKMIQSSLKMIVLADSSKFGRRGFGKICNLDEVDVIITDSGISESTVKTLEESGIELIIV